METINSSSGESRAEAASLVSVDLVSASYRADDFPQDWTAEQRRRSGERYERWLRLKQMYPTQRLAPTRDIDLFWHLHMLAPVAYHRDCMRNFGRIMDHDGGFGKGEAEALKLREVFLATGALWENVYNEPYGEDGRSVRELAPVNCWHNCQNRCWHACSE